MEGQPNRGDSIPTARASFFAPPRTCTGRHTIPPGQEIPRAMASLNPKSRKLCEVADATCGRQDFLHSSGRGLPNIVHKSRILSSAIKKERILLSSFDTVKNFVPSSFLSALSLNLYPTPLRVCWQRKGGSSWALIPCREYSWVTTKILRVSLVIV